MKPTVQKYAELLTHYCLSVEKGQTVYVRSTYLAEPLLQELSKSISAAGGHVVFNIDFQEQNKLIADNSSVEQMEWENPVHKMVMQDFDCYLYVRAPFNLKEDQNIDKAKRAASQKGNKAAMDAYRQRTATLDMKRSLCQYPTQASAQEANMSLKEYEEFVFGACNLFADDPMAEWQKLGRMQQGIVDHLNNSKHIHYKGPNIDVQFSCDGRTWMNSDGKTNMPSGEVYTAPVEDSVNGWVKFTLPSIYFGKEAHNVELEIKDGLVLNWKASQGQDLLDEVFAIDGARRFGEAAIGTNMNIQRMTKNILFDEKIGGTIHMAVGQSYAQCGGKNESSVHWDMITDMKDGGEIFADGELIYKNGAFTI